MLRGYAHGIVLVKGINRVVDDVTRASRVRGVSLDIRVRVRVTSWKLGRTAP